MAYFPSASTHSSQCSSSIQPSILPISGKLTHPDLITFLAVVQHRQLDFVPLTWQAGLGLIGLGGNARISQIHVNFETDFAFKRALRHECSTQDENSTHMYEIFISEVLFLTNPAIRDHPNIANITGICWETTNDNQVYPVIVSEKANGPDLRRWATSFVSSSVSFQDRLGICVDIGNALLAMHSNNIIHGDLKPENVLLFTEDNTRPTAKLTDFGNSSFGYTEKAIVYPSYSEIWSAPECHDRGMALQEAKRNDVYAFGLISIFVMFMEVIGKDSLGSEVMENAVWNFYLRQETPDNMNLPEWIGLMKSTSRLLDRTLEILSVKFPKEHEKFALQDFFRSTICVQPEQRKLNVGLLTQMLDGNKGDIEDTAQVTAADSATSWEDISHFHFRISESILDLTEAPYSLREAIILALKQRTVTSGREALFSCETCSSRAAFELALCYKIGFGTSADEERSNHFLSASAKGECDIHDQILLLRNVKMKSLEEGSPLAKFWQEGTLTIPDNLADALDHQKRADLEAAFSREISDLDGILGDVNAITYTLKISLITIYEQQGRFQFAETACRMALQSISGLLGNHHVITLDCSDRLARILREMGKISEAECIQQSAIALMSDLVGKDHLRMKKLLHNYCDTLELESRFQETAHIREDVFNSLCIILGATHPDVIVAMDKWGLAKRYAGDLKFAANLHHISFMYAEQDCGPRHSITLICIVNYAETLREQKKYEDAETWHQKAVEGFEIQYGMHHRQTALAQHSFGITLEVQNKWLEALAMYHNALKTRMMVLGKDHAETKASEVAWQSALNLTKWRGELQEYQDVLRRNERLTVEKKVEIASIEQNARALMRQGHLAKGADLYIRSLRNKHETSSEERNNTTFTKKIMQVLKRVATTKTDTPLEGNSARHADLKANP